MSDISLPMTSDFDFAVSADVAELEALKMEGMSLQSLTARATEKSGIAEGGMGEAINGAGGSMSGGFTPSSLDKVDTGITPGGSLGGIGDDDADLSLSEKLDKFKASVKEDFDSNIATFEEAMVSGDMNVAMKLADANNSFFASDGMKDMNDIMAASEFGMSKVKIGLELKNDIMGVVKEIQAGNAEGAFASLAGRLGDSDLVNNLVGGMAGSILNMQSIQQLSSIISNVKGLIATIGGLLLKLAGLNEGMFDAMIMGPIIAAQADPTFDKEFINFIYKGDYWLTFNYVANLHSKFRSDVIRRYKSYANRAVGKGAKDTLTAIMKLKVYNTTSSEDKLEVREFASAMTRKVLTGSKCAINMRYLYDYFNAFKLEPGLMSDVDSYVLDTALYCGVGGYRLTDYDVDRMFPIVMVENPITGREDAYIDPVDNGLVSCMKLLMNKSVFTYPLIHSCLGERLKYPIYSRLLHGTLLDNLKSLLILLGLDELIPLIVTRDAILSEFIKHYNPEPVRVQRSYNSYKKGVQLPNEDSVKNDEMELPGDPADVPETPFVLYNCDCSDGKIDNIFRPS